MYKFSHMDNFDQKKHANILGIEAYKTLLTTIERTWDVGGGMLDMVYGSSRSARMDEMTLEWIHVEVNPPNPQWWSPFFGAEQDDVTVQVFVNKANWTEQRTNELCKLVADTIASTMNEAHREHRTDVCVESLSATYDSKRLAIPLQRIHSEEDTSDGNATDSDDDSGEEWLHDAPTDRADKAFGRQEVYYVATTMCGSTATRRFRQQVLGET
jgi:hypothetical protein